MEIYSDGVSYNWNRMTLEPDNNSIVKCIHFHYIYFNKISMCLCDTYTIHIHM